VSSIYNQLRLRITFAINTTENAEKENKIKKASMQLITFMFINQENEE
jgi:hypothetical protein